MIAAGTVNGTYHDLVYTFLLQQFSPVPGDPADDPGNKKKMMIMVACGAGLCLPIIIFKVLRDQADKAEVEAIKKKAQAQVEMSTKGNGKTKRRAKLAPL